MLRIGKPLEGMDLRSLTEVPVRPFLFRLLLYAFLVAASVAVIAAGRGILAWVGIVVLGLTFAHGVELQHQALHNTGFPSRFWNRLVGFFLGLPMLVSFSSYQHSHLEHHRLLGTPEDREFFGPVAQPLTSTGPFLAHLLMLRHYRDVARSIAAALAGRLAPGVKEKVALRIRTEYRSMGVLLALGAAASWVFETDLMLRAWLLPLLIASPVHSLIELPEHWRRDHQTSDLRANTRTVRAGKLATWFTNGNNYHIEHHWLPAVPSHRLPELNERIADQIEKESYFEFYVEFLSELYRNIFRKPSEKSA